jgi:hypothetical protein
MTESEQAKAWREANNLTLAELADLTGYSAESCHLFERGRNSLNKPHNAKAWQRYKMTCLAVTIMRHYKIKSIDQWQWTKHKGRAAGPNRGK